VSVRVMGPHCGGWLRALALGWGRAVWGEVGRGEGGEAQAGGGGLGLGMGWDGIGRGMAIG